MQTNSTEIQGKPVIAESGFPRAKDMQLSIYLEEAGVKLKVPLSCLAGGLT